MTKKIFQVSVPDPRRKAGSRGFTLIELLVVVSIIALLVGILTPGIRAFKKAADGLKQKSRFHAMEVGLELFQKDYDDYPDSQVTTADGSSYICGAQHLTEALVGRDKKGFVRRLTMTNFIPMVIPIRSNEVLPGERDTISNLTMPIFMN